jgi:type IV pilus assembly protein PilW
MKNSNSYLVCYSKGFSLVELMVALAIGLFLLAGVFTAYVNGVKSTRVVDDQTVMVDNVRFALESLNADLSQAGVFGRVLPRSDAGGLINIDNIAATASIVTECYAGWALNATNPVMVSDDAGGAPYGAPCINNYLQGDTLEVRGTLRAPIAAAALQPNVFYINSDVNNARFFYGNVSPNASAGFADYNYYNNFYYIASFSDNPADGIPSLHRVSLLPGGVASDQVLLSGVSDMQIQLGIDTNADGSVDSYVDATPGMNWGQVKSVQVTLTVLSLSSNYTGTNTTAGRRQMTVRNVTALRDINQ